MYEQDYILRIIKEMVRTLLKILFHIDMDNPTDELLEDSSEKQTLNTLLDLADAGKIDEAENRVYELTSGQSMPGLKIALLFYSHLNDKTDDFLEKNDFSRVEIKMGVDHLAKQYDLDNILELFSE